MASLPISASSLLSSISTFHPGEAGNYVGMWNGNAINDNDADTFLYKPNNNFWSAGAGVVGDADSWAFDGWFRFAQRVDYSEDTADIYVNGVHVVTTVAPDWLYNSVSGNPVWMLADNNGETQLMYCANMAIVDAYMSEADISALGGPMAAGIFSGNPVAGTGASYDASCNCTVRTAWEANSNGELYMGDDTTCGDTTCPLPSNNTCAGAIMITESVTAFDSSDASTSDFVYDWASCSGSYPGDMGKDVWYHFTPTEDGVATVTTCDGGSYDTTIAVLEGEACESLLMAACNGDGSGGKGCQELLLTSGFQCHRQAPSIGLLLAATPQAVAAQARSRSPALVSTTARVVIAPVTPMVTA